ncbi:MAG: hypothetical protein KDC44_01160, partial [Phaeodactylibacter sp.]|nr:hypothetical protein [Phaeodactylibacter sp.]
MKTTLSTCLLFFLLLLGQTKVAAQGQFCEDFAESVGHWSGINATVVLNSNSNSGSFLDISDNQQESWLTNNAYDHDEIGCGTITYKYVLTNDGFVDT